MNTIVTAGRPAVSPPPATRGKSRLFEAWTLLMFLMPVYGTIYPPETYFVTNMTAETELSASKVMPLILVLITVGTGILFASMRARQRVRHDWPIYIYFVACVASLAYSPAPSPAFNRVLRIVPQIGLALVYSQIMPYKKLLRLMTIAMLISAAVSIFMAVAFPVYGLSNLGGVYESAWRGATLHKNSAGYCYSIGLLLALYGWQSRAVSPGLACATLLTCLLMVIKAQSASALLSMAFAAGCVGMLQLLSRTRQNTRVLFIAIFVALALIGGLIVAAMPEVIAALIGRDLTLTGRTEVWEGVWDLIQRRPLGSYGYAFWQIDSPERTYVWTVAGYAAFHSHNSWLDLWLQIGIVGVIVVVIDLIRSLGFGIAAIVSRRDLTALLPVALLIALIVRSFTEVEFSEPAPSGIFWLMLCSIILRNRRAQWREQQKQDVVVGATPRHHALAA